jgi:exopolyphosphatase/guanosine-5'-triphosphate,3'-diphosphate pyrophosphatase
MRPQRCAFFDIGTNTILCLIAELAGGGSFAVLDDLAEIPRLGQGVDATGRIAALNERASAALLERYLRRCEELGVEEIVAVGTSALRDAENSAEVRERWRAALGVDVRVLTGEEEAAYSFLAVQKGLALAHCELLVIDIGGGSAEFIRGNASGIGEASSVDLGSVRLTERYLRSDPPAAEELAAMTAVIDRELLAATERWRGGHAALRLVGIAGTFTTLAAVEKKLVRYSHNEVHGSSLTLAEVRRQVKLFGERTLAERRKIPGLEPKRADVILAGAVLIERIMTSFASESVIVSDQGVRYGLLHERLSKYEEKTI